MCASFGVNRFNGQISFSCMSQDLECMKKLLAHRSVLRNCIFIIDHHLVAENTSIM